MIDPIENGESGLSVRNKINQAFSDLDARTGDVVQLQADVTELQGERYPSRADLVAAISGGLVPLNGVTYRAGGFEYRGQTGATAISDLPGLVPNGVFFRQHFGNVPPAVTDDAAALQAAVNRAAAVGGGTVSIGSDKLRVETSVVIAGDRVSLRGGGMDAAQIMAVGNIAAITLGDGSGGGSASAEYCNVSGMTFTAAAGATTARGILIRNAFFPNLADLKFTPAGGAALECCVDVTNESGYDITLRDIFANANATGLRLGASGAGTRPQNVYQYNTHWNDMSVAGVDIRAVGGFVWHGGETLVCTRGMVIQPGNGQECSGGYVSGVFFDTCDNEVLRIAPSSSNSETRDWTFVGCGFNHSCVFLRLYLHLANKGDLPSCVGVGWHIVGVVHP